MAARLEGRLRRKRSIRKKISGTAERPRLSFYRSLRGIYVQAIDDRAQRTLFAFGTKAGKNVESSKALAEKMAENEAVRAKKTFVFDRNGGEYYGVIKVFCETLREKGFKL